MVRIFVLARNFTLNLAFAFFAFWGVACGSAPDPEWNHIDESALEPYSRNAYGACGDIPVEGMCLDSVTLAKCQMICGKLGCRFIAIETTCDTGETCQYSEDAERQVCAPPPPVACDIDSCAYVGCSSDPAYYCNGSCFEPSNGRCGELFFKLRLFPLTVDGPPL